MSAHLLPVAADSASRLVDGANGARSGVQPGRQASPYNVKFALPLPEGIGGVTIKYAGHTKQRFDIDRSGFTIVEARRDEIDFCDAGRIKQSYYPVVEQSLRAVFDGARVITLGHTFRRSVPSSVELSPIFGTAARRVVVRSPTFRVLGGETERAVKAKLAYSLGEQQADALMRNRVMLVTVWRPVGAAARLAVCDARTVAYEDIAAITPECIDDGDDHVRPALSFSSEQDWFYFPNRPGNEAIILKDYDSIEDGRAKRCFRAAMRSGAGSLNASIEVHAAIVFQQA